MVQIPSIGKVINKANPNKDSDLINLDLLDIMTESSLNFSHDFWPNTPTVAHLDLLTSPASNSGKYTNAPTADFNINAETPNSIRRFERIEIDDLKNEII